MHNKKFLAYKYLLQYYTITRSHKIERWHWKKGWWELVL